MLDRDWVVMKAQPGKWLSKTQNYDEVAKKLNEATNICRDFYKSVYTAVYLDAKKYISDFGCIHPGEAEMGEGNVLIEFNAGKVGSFFLWMRIQVLIGWLYLSLYPQPIAHLVDWAGADCSPNNKPSAKAHVSCDSRFRLRNYPYKFTNRHATSVRIMRVLRRVLWEIVVESLHSSRLASFVRTSIFEYFLSIKASKFSSALVINVIKIEFPPVLESNWELHMLNDGPVMVFQVWTFSLHDVFVLFYFTVDLLLLCASVHQILLDIPTDGWIWAICYDIL